jgi:hypothetical protein
LPLKSLLKLLVSLRVSLSTAKIAWIREFVSDTVGVSALGGVLDRVLVSNRQQSSEVSSDVEEEIRSECMKCLRALLKTEPGYTSVLRSQLVVTKMVLCLHTENNRLRMTVTEVLAALCILSAEGHQMVT